MADVVTAEGVVITRGSRVAISASDFSIPAGKITAIIGPNGSGKSTILHAIAGLLSISSGNLSVFNNTPLLSQSQISYVLQYTTVPAGTPLTVMEAVAMARYPGLGLFGRPSQEDKKLVLSAMERLEISNLAKRHLTELSGGQGIAQDHSILLLDEPLTGLDLNSARTIDSIIHDEPVHGCSVVLTTHDLEEARAADHVILTAGSVVGSGKPADVLTTENLTNAYGLGSLHEEKATDLILPTEHHLNDHPH